MAIRFFCPLGHRLKVPDERAGKKGRCPVCEQRLIVPNRSVVEPFPSSVVPPPAAAKTESIERSAESRSDLALGKPVAAAADPAPTAELPAHRETPPVTPPVAEPDAAPIATADAPVETPLSMVTTAVDTPPGHFDEQSVVVGMAAMVDVTGEEPRGGEVLPGEPLIPAFDTDGPAPPAGLSALAPVIAAAPPPLPPAAVSRNGVVPTSPAERSDVRGPARRLKWAAWVRGEMGEGFAVSRPTPRQVEVVYWLACLLPFAAVFCAAPAVPYMHFVGAPAWAQILLFVACLQAAYAAWLATVPDWSTVRVGTYFFGAVTAMHSFTAITLALLPDSPLASLGLAGTRGTTAAWCILSAAVSGSVSAACRWIDRRWRAGAL